MLIFITFALFFVYEHVHMCTCVLVKVSIQSLFLSFKTWSPLGRELAKEHRLAVSQLLGLRASVL